MKGDNKVLTWQFLYLGFVCLFGFNAMLSCNDYLKTSPAFTDGFSNDAAFWYGLAMNITLPPLTIWGSKLSRKAQCTLGGVLMSAAIAGLSLFALSSSTPSKVGYLAVALLGVGTSIFQGMVMSLAGQHSGHAMSMVSNGQALSGLCCLPLTMIFEAIAKAVSPDNVLQVQYQMFLVTAVVASMLVVPVFALSVARHSSVTGMDATTTLDAPAAPKSSILSVFKSTWKYSIAIWLNFFILFSVFGLMGVRFPFADNLGMDVSSYFRYAFFTFNLADFAGRFLVTLGLSLNLEKIYAITITRLLPAALMLTCAYSSKVFFQHWATKFAVIFVLSVMQGPAVTWSFILSPSKLKNAADNATLGTINTFAIVNGIFIGTLVCKLYL